MKIECPNCKLTGQISDIKIPPEGQHMDCPRCQSSFFVQKSAPSGLHDSLSDCPKCGYSTFSGERFDICPTCGLVAKTHIEQRGQSQEAARSEGRAVKKPAGIDPAGIDPERMRQDLEKVRLLEEARRHRSRADGVAPPLPVRQREPDAVVAPQLVTYLGWLFVIVGLLVLAWGGTGLYRYVKMSPADLVASQYDTPPGPFRVYLDYGLFPILRTFLGVCVLFAGWLFQSMHPAGRKTMEAVVWTGVGYVVTYQVYVMLAWLRRSSGMASSQYYFAGLADTVLMILLWSTPLAAAIWYLRRDVIREAFGE